MSETRKPKLTAGKSVNASAKVKVTDVKPVTTVTAKPVKKAAPTKKVAEKAPAKKAVSSKAKVIETPVEAVSVGLWARFKAFFLGA